MATAMNDLVLSIITTLDVAIDHYKVPEDDKGLREAFHESGRGLPLIRTALHHVQSQLGRRQLTGNPERALASLRECIPKGETSERIFNAVAQAPETSRFEAYKAAVRQEGKGRLIEELLVGMMTGVCDVAEDLAIDDQVKALREAIERLSQMEPSVPREESGAIFNNYGSGEMLNAPYGTINMSSGTGPQFPGATFSGSVSFGNTT
ncbi:uncharacterized protein N7496_001888 [Penicillium cataractarum]|uniref:NACHT-NTPase and P-loop NTPases N-terminal domain-containing protein n=1 Tax=Penicillium cataractarum TaxID=2100454 RepID=A0A9W9VX44_9EURO|nr:uncharacterized protein N7496_001888 [Penicillium cataractarum]KAJ5390820.1 hypothetical protein N7496_001888 [Penicillium cataractarum]